MKEQDKFFMRMLIKSTFFGLIIGISIMFFISMYWEVATK